MALQYGHACFSQQPAQTNHNLHIPTPTPLRRSRTHISTRSHHPHAPTPPAPQSADYASKAKELEDATAERDGVRREYEALRKARLDGFMAGFEAISMRLKVRGQAQAAAGGGRGSRGGRRQLGKTECVMVG